MVLTRKVKEDVCTGLDSEYTIDILECPEIKVADSVFICNPDNGYVEYECSVKSIKDDSVQLHLVHSTERHPWLSIDALIDNEILSEDFIDRGIAKLSNTSEIQIRTIFRNPERYK